MAKSEDTTNSFYVYMLFRPDGSVCYVGKGKGSRCRYSAMGRGCNNRRLANLIKKSGGRLRSTFVQQNMSEEDAFALEIKLINDIGRIPDGPLLNITEGGESGPGCKGETHWNKESHPEVADAIRTRITEYWEHRRKKGLTLTNRDEAGHKKHSIAIRLRMASMTPSERRPKKITKNMIVVVVDGETVSLSEACRRLNMSFDAVKKRIHRGMPAQQALDMGMKIKRGKRWNNVINSKQENMRLCSS